MYDSIILRQRLLALADKKYAAFHGHLLPPDTPLIGVRLPQLRKIAKDICRNQKDALSYLESALSDYHEERLLQGLVIAGLKTDAALQKQLIIRFLPKIDTWAICDSFCTSLRSFPRLQTDGWKWLIRLMHSPEPYTKRFAFVMALSHYADAIHIPTALAEIDRLKTDSGYYVEMAVAWAISVFFIKEKQLVLDWLPGCRLNAFTFRMAIQKCCDSHRISPKEKSALRLLKRCREGR